MSLIKNPADMLPDSYRVPKVLFFPGLDTVKCQFVRWAGNLVGEVWDEHVSNIYQL
jgi:hypothetical protein